MAMGISDEFTNFERQAVIKVCGVGGGGGNAVGRMIAAGMGDVEFITINTDAQALKNSPAGTRLQIGDSGLGAGAKPAVGRAAAESDRERIAEVLQGADMIFLTAGMGGGTGTGATPVVAEVAKQTNALTVAIVTMPFQFEGQGRMENAARGLAELEQHVDALIVVPNDRLALLCNDNITFLNAFKLADEVLHNGVRSISELITVPGLINLDFSDVRTIMQGSGRALMGIGTAEGDKRAVRAAQEAIVCPLLEKSSIDGAMGVIVNVKGGSNMGMREVLEAVTTVQRAAHPKANIIFGAVVEDDEEPEIQVTVIAAGFAQEFLQPVQPFTETVSLSLEVDEHFEPGRPEELEPAPMNVELFDRREADVEPLPALGEQFLFSAEDLAPEPEFASRFTESEPDEDLGIPAFMRKRMKTK